MTLNSGRVVIVSWLRQTLACWLVINILQPGHATHHRFKKNAYVESEESRLTKRLLRIYNEKGIYGRPVTNFSDTMKVQFGLQLFQIMNLDERNQILTLNVWNHLRWIDIYLTWNVSEYQGVSEVRLPPDKIWTPDIKLYNFADTRINEYRDALCIIKNTGEVEWIPQAIYKSSCSIDVASFPFDKQVCELKFGSWTWGGYKLDLNFLNGVESMNLNDYKQSNVWDIIGAPAKKNNLMYTCCPEPFIDITFELIIRRRATFYAYILILPCVLLTSLTLVLFWIPPESPAKMQLGMSIFMAYFVLLLLFEANLPPAASSVPILGTYYCLNMVLITLSSFLNVFVVNMTFFGARSNVPCMLKKIMFSIVAKIVCMENLVLPFKDDLQVTVPPPSKRCLQVNGENKWAPPNDWRGSNELLANASKDSPQLAEILVKVSEMRNLMKVYKERIDERDRKDKVAREWKALALVFDRIFFIVYLSTITVSLCVVLPIIFTGMHRTPPK